MDQTETLLRRQLRVRGPAGAGGLVPRPELDRDSDVDAVDVSDGGGDMCRLFLCRPRRGPPPGCGR